MTWNLADLFESVVDAVADREAVVAGGLHLDYAALDERANRIAHVLEEQDVGVGDHVALALRNGNEYLEGMLAAFKLRAVPVNVNVRYGVDELRHLLGGAVPVVAITEGDIADALAAALPRSSHMIERGDEYEALLSAAPSTRPIVQGRSGDDRYVLYTGGTTGLPKGVMWRHEDLLFAALAGGNLGGDPVRSPEEVAEHAPSCRTRCLPASPFTHGTAHWTALATLLSGGTVIVDTSPSLDAERLWDLVADEHVTILVIVGDAFALPLVDALDAAPDRRDLSELLIVLSGGALLSPGVRERLLVHLPWAVMVDGYGTSETGGQGQMPLWPGQTAAPLPRFHVNEDTVVLDDSGRPAPPGSGITGRLARKGRIPLGYLGDPDGSAMTFVESAGQRWAVPGDLGRVEADGSVTLLGRGAASINSGGEKVFPDEVELALKAHDDVYDAVVVGVPDDRFGERVAAVVQLRDGSSVDVEVLRSHCRDRLAGFKVPRTVVVVDQVARRPSGKADIGWAKQQVLRFVT